MKKQINQSPVTAAAAAGATDKNQDGSANDKKQTGATGVKEVNLEHMP